MNTRALWLGLLLAAAGLAQAQPLIQINLPVAYDLYFVGDLDPRGDLSGVGQEITVQVSNLALGTYNLDVELSYGGTWLAQGHVNNILVSESQLGPWSLAQIRADQVPGFNGSGDFNDAFLEQISGNALPSGVYTVAATVTSVLPALPPVSTSSSFIINDPRRVDLQSPWDGAVQSMAEPVFSWSGRASTYLIKVCEFDRERHGSPQEALEGEAMWQATVPGQTSVIYGELGSARPLQTGRQYVWNVEAVLNTTSGRRQFASAIRTFTFSQGGDAPEQGLNNLLGGLSPSQLAGLANLLENYRLNGTILVDGRPVSLAEFEGILQRIASGELNISSIRIE
ncbi:MAG: hypothetical protein WC326_11415 [Candidatus Delongbacteria bacterium]